MLTAQEFDLVKVNLVSAVIVAVFLLGLAALLWLWARPVEWLGNLLREILSQFVAKDKVDAIVDRVDNAAEVATKWSEKYADEMVRLHLPQNPVMREAALSIHYEECIEEFPECEEECKALLSEIRKILVEKRAAKVK